MPIIENRQQVGPIVSGPMASHVGWRNFWWLITALNVFTILCCVFLFPETKFHRPFGYADGKTVTRSGGVTNTSGYNADSNEKIEKSQTNEGMPSNTDAENGITAHDEIASATMNPVITHQDPFLGRGKPSKQQWKLWQPYEGNMIKEFILPWELLLFPIVEFAAFVVSWSASSFLTLNLTQSQAFAAPPYNLGPQTIGFFNFAILVGALIGLFTSGPLSDYVAAVLTRRNRGIREPEMRLLTMIPYVILMIISNVVVAVGYEKKWSWKVIVFIGYTLSGVQVAALPAIASTYAVDSYKPVAGSLFVAITVNKNVWGYGFSKFITPWIIKNGYIPPIMTNMALITLWCLFGILFWFKGKTFRKWTRNSKVHSM
jgi:hypothetical protein